MPMSPNRYDPPVTLGYASVRKPGRSWSEVNFVNVFLGVAVPLAIVGLAVLFLTPTCRSGTGNRTRHDLTCGKIGAMKIPLELYRQHVGVYPTSLDDLVTAPAGAAASRWAGPYISNLDDLKDGWDQPFKYKAPGVKNPRAYDLWSNGPDGAGGTRDDICNWR
jgi:general secretion pathway protein G